MITGFNTDIPYDGVTYHVQTEDKGLDTPLILSLVYVGGAIIASKRTPYADLISRGFDESVLTERLQRQHKLICAAVKSGRIEDLKRMSGSDGGSAQPEASEAARKAGAAKRKRSDAPTPEQTAAPVGQSAPNYVAEGAPAGPRAPAPPEPEPVPVEPIIEAVVVEEPEELSDEIYLSLLDDEGEFRAGQLVTVKIYVGRGAYGQRPVGEAGLTVKVLGTSFRPIIVTTTTDEHGVGVVRALLPRFNSGRAAIIIRAVADEHSAEMRRIIHQ